MKKKLDIYNLSSYNIRGLITKDMFDILNNVKERTTLNINGLSLDPSSNGIWYISCDELKDKVKNLDEYIEEELGYSIFVYETHLRDFIKDELIESDMPIFKNLFWNMQEINKTIYVFEIESDDIILNNLNPMRIISSALSKNIGILNKSEAEVLNYVSDKLLENINSTPEFINNRYKSRFKITEVMHDELRQAIIWAMERSRLNKFSYAADRIDEFSYGEDSMTLTKDNIDCSKTVFEILKTNEGYFIDVFIIKLDDHGGDDIQIKPGKNDVIRFLDYFQFDLLYNDHMEYLIDRLKDVIESNN